MAWPHYRALSSRLVKGLEVREGSEIRDCLRIWKREYRLDGRLTSWSTLPRAARGSKAAGEGERYVVGGNKKNEGEVNYGIAVQESGEKLCQLPLDLNSGRVVDVPSGDLASLNYGHRRYGGIRVLHTSAVAGAPETTTADFTSTHHHHLEPVETIERLEEDVLQMENGALLYSGMKSTELFATFLNLQLVSFEPMVDLSLKVLKSPLMNSRILSAPIFLGVKRTAYSHFCAGENAAEAAVTLKRMWELGLKGILDYSLEDAEDNKTCEQNTAGFLNTIQHTRSLPEGSVSYACVKISAICPIGVLERVSDLLRWQHKNPECKLPWKEEGLPVLASGSPTYQTKRAPDGLSSQEERDLLRGQERLRQLCEACAARNLPLLVDAEYSTIQPAIDYMTYKAAFEFNRGIGPGVTPIVYNTLQTYLKDAPSRLALAAAESSRRNASLALKIVRGAYITRENALAVSLQAPSPIQDTIQDTHRCYNSCASFILERIASKGSAALMLATHNVDSGRFAAMKVLELGLDKKDTRIHFAQLKGMSDRLSLALARGGFNVSKYLPFGPVTHVIPYLLRRAEENRGLLGNTKGDRQSIRAELVRRVAVAAGFK